MKDDCKDTLFLLFSTLSMSFVSIFIVFLFKLKFPVLDVVFMYVSLSLRNSVLKSTFLSTYGFLVTDAIVSIPFSIVLISVQF